MIPGFAFPQKNPGFFGILIFIDILREFAPATVAAPGAISEKVSTWYGSPK